MNVAAQPASSAKPTVLDLARVLLNPAWMRALALVLATLVFQVPIDTWKRWAPWIFVLSLVLLILVLIPFIGKGVNGARRWIALGVMNFQPSELAKLGVLLYAANYMVRKMDVKEKFFNYFVNLSTTTAETINWLGILVLLIAPVPSFIAVMSGLSERMPPLDVVLLLWGGLSLLFIRSAILKDMLMVVTIGLGFIIQAMLLGLTFFV